MAARRGFCYTKAREVRDAHAKAKGCRLPALSELMIAGTEEEVLTVAVRHAVEEHGHKNSPELREQIRALLKDE